MSATTWILAALVGLSPAIASLGCGGESSVADQSAAVQQDGRAQPLMTQAQTNPFVGDWGPAAGYVANDWQARFSADGRMSVNGPGLTARGMYSAEGQTANVNYMARDGAAPTDSKLGHATFVLSSNGQELTFGTGLANDPPVHLRRNR